MEKFQNKYRIPTARAKWHDYNGGEYFITICTAGREHYFGEIRNGVMILNILGEFISENTRNVSAKNRNTEIPLFVVMPNHIHLIVCIEEPNGGFVETWPAASINRDATGHVSTGGMGISEKMQEIANHCGLLSTTIGGIKSAVTRYARANKIDFVWQTRFHDHIIRSQDEMNRIACYIENNVTTWENDRFYIK